MNLENYRKKFQVLSESKLGDVKPYLVEQGEAETPPANFPHLKDPKKLDLPDKFVKENYPEYKSYYHFLKPNDVSCNIYQEWQSPSWTISIQIRQSLIIPYRGDGKPQEENRKNKDIQNRIEYAASKASTLSPKWESCENNSAFCIEITGVKDVKEITNIAKLLMLF